MKFYAYSIDNTKQSGIVTDWGKCQEIVKGKKAKYKSFKTKSEAEKWLNSGAEYKPKTGKFYAYYFQNENQGGICLTWDECQKVISNKKASYKSFKTKSEAEKWINDGGRYLTKQELQSNLPDGIYFDAGTGRGIGVEVRVTNKLGQSILERLLPSNKINQYGNYLTKEGSTNNFGELLGIYIALKISINESCKNIYGDSNLIIEYWSKGFAKRNELPKETVELIEKVVLLRKEFEKNGGIIKHVSGDINPADLGFHK